MPPAALLLAHVVQGLQRRGVTHRFARTSGGTDATSPRAPGGVTGWLPSDCTALLSALIARSARSSACARSSAMTCQRSASARRSAISAAATASASSARSRPKRSERTNSSTVGAEVSASVLAAGFENAGCTSVGSSPACSRSLTGIFHIIRPGSSGDGDLYAFGNAPALSLRRMVRGLNRHAAAASRTMSARPTG